MFRYHKCRPLDRLERDSTSNVYRRKCWNLSHSAAIMATLMMMIMMMNTLPFACGNERSAQEQHTARDRHRQVAETTTYYHPRAAPPHHANVFSTQQLQNRDSSPSSLDVDGSDMFVAVGPVAAPSLYTSVDVSSLSARTSSRMKSSGGKGDTSKGSGKGKGGTKTISPSTESTGKGMGSMMSSSSGKGMGSTSKGGKGMGSTTSPSPSLSYSPFPSTTISPEPTVINTTDVNGTSSEAPTAAETTIPESNIPSFVPTLTTTADSPTPTLAPIGKGGMMMSSMKETKGMMMGGKGSGTIAPTSSLAPSNSFVPSLPSMGKKKMSMKADPKTPTPSVVSSPTPTVTAVPTRRKGKGMSKGIEGDATLPPSMKGGKGMADSTKDPSPSPSGKGMMSSSSDKGKGMGQSMGMGSGKGKSEKTKPSKSPEPSQSPTPSIDTTKPATKKPTVPKVTKAPLSVPAPIIKTKSPAMAPVPEPPVVAPPVPEPPVVAPPVAGPPVVTPPIAEPPGAPPVDPPVAPPVLPDTTTAPTNSPTAGPSLRVRLSLLSLRYTFDQTRIPTDEEVQEVVNVTQNYLTMFFQDRLQDLMGLESSVNSTSFRLGEPFEINFTSTAVYSPDATNIPPGMELDLVLAEAFDGDNLLKYFDLILALPGDNIFKTTMELAYYIQERDMALTNSGTQRSSSSGGGNKHQQRVTGGTLAGASAGAALLAAFLLWGRKRHLHKTSHNGTLHSPNYTGVSKDPDDMGHVTVAGDTYNADSTVITNASFRRQTRFAEETYLIDDTHSLASRSDWGMHQVSEATGTEDSTDEEEPTDVNQSLLQTDTTEHDKGDALAGMDNCSQRWAQHINENDELSDNDEDDLSVDDDVPMKVVDLIKKFTPLRGSQG